MERREKKRHFDVFTVLLRYEGRFFFIILLRVNYFFSQGKNLATATYTKWFFESINNLWMDYKVLEIAQNSLTREISLRQWKKSWALVFCHVHCIFTYIPCMFFGITSASTNNAPRGIFSSFPNVFITLSTSTTCCFSK